MSIIEKLGITPGPWEWHKHNGLDSSALFFGNDDDDIILDDGSAYDEYSQKIDPEGGNANVIAAAPEMFLWIYGMMKATDNNDMIKAAQLLELGPELIKKATDKSWEVIKELK